MSNNNFTKLVLKNVLVEFFNKGDQKFKPSLVINTNDSTLRAKIGRWVEDNRIGRGKEAGKPIFTEYKPDGDDGEVHLRYLFRITDRTKFKGINGLGLSDLGRGSRVSLVANAYKYTSDFGDGIGKSLTAVKILTPAENSCDKDMDELMGENDDEDIDLDDFDETEDKSEEIKEEDIPSFD